MKRRGRWWVVDSVKQEERPMEYMTFKTADIDRRGGLFYSVNKFRIYSLDSLLNNMAYFGWEPAQSSVPGELVFRRPKNSGPYTSFNLEFESEGKK